MEFIRFFKAIIKVAGKLTVPQSSGDKSSLVVRHFPFLGSAQKGRSENQSVQFDCESDFLCSVHLLKV